MLFVQGFVMRILERIGEASLEGLEAVIAIAEQFLAELAQAIGLIAQRLDEIGRTLQRLATQIADAAAGALADLDALVDGFSSTSGRSRFVNQLASSVASNALAVSKTTGLTTTSCRAGSGGTSAIASGTSFASRSRHLHSRNSAAIGVIRDQFEEILEDARGLDRHAPLAPQVSEMLIARLAALVGDRYGTVRIQIAFTVRWTTPLGRASHDFDLGRISVQVGNVVDIVRPVAEGFGAFEAAVDALTDRIRVVFDAEQATTALHNEEQAVEDERARLEAIAAEQLSGPKSLVIERPVQMQTAGADTLVTIRLEGFSTTVLTVDDDTPQRLFILVNGEPVALDSFHVDATLSRVVLTNRGRPGTPQVGDRRRGAIAARSNAEAATQRIPRRREILMHGSLPGAAQRSVAVLSSHVSSMPAGQRRIARYRPFGFPVASRWTC